MDRSLYVNYKNEKQEDEEEESEEGEMEEEQMESDEEEDDGFPWKGLQGWLVVGAWAFFTLMVLAFQLMSWRRAIQGEAESWKVIVSGVFGAFLSLCGIALVALDCTAAGQMAKHCTAAQKEKCGDFISVGFFISFLFMVVCFIMFIIVMFLPTTTASSLTSVQTALTIRPTCLSGKLLDVSELLTYSINPPKAMNVSMPLLSVVRNLPAQIEASDFTVEGISVIENATITDESDFMPSKTSVSYAKQKPTRSVTIGFDELSVARGQPPLQCTLRLNYTARVPADFIWVVPEARAKVVTSLSVLCPIPETALASTCSAIKLDFTSYKLNLPLNVTVGTDACPFAWVKPEQSWIWYVGSGFLAVGVCLCYFLGDGTMGLLFMMPGALCLCIGGVISLIALYIDVSTQSQ